MKIQKIGGIGSMGTAILVVMMLAIGFIVFPRLGIVASTDWFDPVKVLNASSASPMTFFILGLMMILCGISYILFVLALRERMEAGAPTLMRAAVIAVSITGALWLADGLISIIGMPIIAESKDVSAFRAVMAVISGLGTSGDGAAGWALLLIGLAALKTRGLPQMLGYLSILKGAVMILEFTLQPLTIIGMFLGIVFYPWLGIVLLRPLPRSQEMPLGTQVVSNI